MNYTDRLLQLKKLRNNREAPVVCNDCGVTIDTEVFYKDGYISICNKCKIHYNYCVSCKGYYKDNFMIICPECAKYLFVCHNCKKVDYRYNSVPYNYFDGAVYIPIELCKLCYNKQNE